VNPSLWRNAQLNLQYGLFKVADEIYQVRGYDLSNITFVRGKTGWIVFDPLVSVETARAAYDLVTANLGQRPVLAVVYSHSHICLATTTPPRARRRRPPRAARA
jgi:alkyl sulfatase BDS1-like metallo-beta-lactamase superfamily hydrolase